MCLEVTCTLTIHRRIRVIGTDAIQSSVHSPKSRALLSSGIDDKQAQMGDYIVIMRAAVFPDHIRPDAFIDAVGADSWRLDAGPSRSYSE